jgi:putative ATPase
MASPISNPLPPLAERMRPKTLAQFAGQPHLVAEGKPIYQMIQTGKLHSMILWGPPGVGKTTLASIIAQSLNLAFYTLNAIDSGVKDVIAVIDNARKGGDALLFIDEIHRFNKSQQDSLLHAIERGIITLIGATTENPSFEVISALQSRCQIHILQPLAEGDLKALAQRALAEDKLLAPEAYLIVHWEALLHFSDGDARRLLNMLELATASMPAGSSITNEIVEAAIQQKNARYDKTGEQHYDIISAFIKSMRGSDPNAAVYYLARMIAGGEDPNFIARRMVILASEDVGNANPNALLLATSTAQAVSMIGWPESRIILAQCATYLASSPKSNASYMAINKAQALVDKTGDLPVPLHLRNAPTRLMKTLGYGENYQYAHNFEA